MEYGMRFEPMLEKAFTTAIEKIAPAMWGNDIDFGRVSVCAGNIADYGRFVANCRSTTTPTGFSVISFPTGNRFSVVEHNIEGYLCAKAGDIGKAQGVLLHELGHHAVRWIERTGQPKPWENIKPGAYDTHTEPAWCWVAATGWRYFHKSWTGTPQMLADLIRQKTVREGVSIIDKMATFEPQDKPFPVRPEDEISVPIHCGHCEQLFKPKRNTAQYCSAKCRAAASRKRQPHANALP